MSDAFNQTLPASLAALLADPRIVIPGESEVLEMVATWALAPAATPSSYVEPEVDMAADLHAWASAVSATTPSALVEA